MRHAGPALRAARIERNLRSRAPAAILRRSWAQVPLDPGAGRRPAVQRGLCVSLHLCQPLRDTSFSAISATSALTV